MKSTSFPNQSISEKSESRPIKERVSEWVSILGQNENISIAQALKLTSDYGISIPLVLNPTAPFPSKLFRVRVIAPDSEEDITDPQTFSYPPAKCVTRYQRANAPDHPVFYGAMDGKTAFEEVLINGERKIAKGDKAFLSEWRFKPSSKYVLCFITSPGIQKPTQTLADLTKHIYSEIERIFEKETLSFKEHQSYLYKEISQIYLNGKYILSGTLSHKILYETPEVQGIKIGGIIYPSCSNDYRSANVALHPDFVDECLELVNVRQVIFKHYSNNAAHTSAAYLGYPVDKRVKWGSYQSIPDFNSVEFAIEIEGSWERADIVESVIQFPDGGEYNFREYLDNAVKNFQFPQNGISLDLEPSFEEAQTWICNYELKFEKDTNLKHGNEVVPIQSATLKIPMTSILKDVKL